MEGDVECVCGICAEVTANLAKGGMGESIPGGGTE